MPTDSWRTIMLAYPKVMHTVIDLDLLEKECSEIYLSMFDLENVQLGSHSKHPFESVAARSVISFQESLHNKPCGSVSQVV